MSTVSKVTTADELLKLTRSRARYELVRQDRVPPGGPPRNFWPGAPDLAIEVASPGDTPREIDEKVANRLQAGCQAVWVVDPRRKTVTAHRSGRAIETFQAADTLDGGTVLPGFRCSVAELFTDVS
jgi:Uma2 family endonuclease